MGYVLCSRVLRVVAVVSLVASVGVMVAAGLPAQAGTTFLVDTTIDSHDATPGDGICADATGKCSLRAAVEESNALAGADDITVPAGTYTHTIASRVVFLDHVTITGAGAGVTTVDADGLSGVFDLNSQFIPPDMILMPDVTITGFTITGGDAFGGGIHVEDGTLTVVECVISGNTGPRGGGIFNDYGTVTITDSTIQNNKATNASGGGIYNGMSMTITGSTINDNVATAASVFTYGGGIRNYGTLSLTNSTVSGNDSDRGAGIYNGSSGVLTLVHSTVANNSAASTGGGGGINNDGGSFTMTASILDGNMSPAVRTDCASTVAPTSGGYNFIGDGTGCLWVAATGDIVGTAALPISVGLGPLQDNGGPTETHALVAGGPPLAINTIPAASCTAAMDQRGVTRPQGDRCDKGAFEVKAPVAVDDDYQTPSDTPLDVAAPGVLGNDVEGDGGSLSVSIPRIGNSFPMATDHGEVTYRMDGSFTYTPDAGYAGTDSFSYVVKDATSNLQNPHPNTDTATVTITVGAADTVGLVDPGSGIWRLRDGAGVVSQFFYGNPGDYPFMGDWDCDGIDTSGLYRQSDGFAYLRNSNTQGTADVSFFFGNPGDVPIAGDFNADGCDTLSIYRPSNQRFYVINALGQDGGGLGAADYDFLFGNPGDKPVVGDWDGDGIDEIGLHRESTGFFYYRNTLSTGVADGELFFGDPGDRFVAGDWGIVDGLDTPGLFRPSNVTFYFRHTMTQGNADSLFTWTGAGASWLPVAGNFGL